MTTLQFLSLLMMPVGGLIVGLVGLVGLYVTRHTREHTQTGE